MQRLSDLEAQSIQLRAENTELKAENRALREEAQKIPSADALADAIGARLVRVEQNLREDFVGKFAGSFLLASETITKRVVDTEERHTEIEEELAAHRTELATMLDEANQPQLGTLQRFINAIKQHHEKNEKTLTAQQAAVEGCNHAAQASVQSAAICANFKKDYEETTKIARRKWAMRPD
jgi:hypothetical protein